MTWHLDIRRPQCPALTGHVRYLEGINLTAAECVVKKPKVGSTVHVGAGNGASTLCTIVKLNKSS